MTTAAERKLDAVGRMPVLAATPPFDRLTERELLLVAEQTSVRRFGAGDYLMQAGDVAPCLFVQVSGVVWAGEQKAPALFDAPSALFSLAVEADYRAGAGGAELLCIAKPHLFTIARECPDFITALVAIERGKR